MNSEFTDLLENKALKKKKKSLEMEAKSVIIFSHGNNEKENEHLRMSYYFYYLKCMVLLPPELTDFMFWENLLYLTKLSTLTEKRPNNDIN